MTQISVRYVKKSEPVWERLGASFREYPGASFVEKKSKIYFLISDDVIHGRLLMTSHKSETTLVRLHIRHMTSIT